jgi:hypothetical protein
MSNCTQTEPLRAKAYLCVEPVQAKEVLQYHRYRSSTQACQIQGPRHKSRHRDCRNLKSLTTYVHLLSHPDLRLLPSKAPAQTC